MEINSSEPVQQRYPTEQADAVEQDTVETSQQDAGQSDTQTDDSMSDYFVRHESTSPIDSGFGAIPTSLPADKPSNAVATLEKPQTAQTTSKTDTDTDRSKTEKSGKPAEEKRVFSLDGMTPEDLKRLEGVTKQIEQLEKRLNINPNPGSKSNGAKFDPKSPEWNSRLNRMMNGESSRVPGSGRNAGRERPWNERLERMMNGLPGGRRFLEAMGAGRRLSRGASGGVVENVNGRNYESNVIAGWSSGTQNDVGYMDMPDGTHYKNANGPWSFGGKALVQSIRNTDSMLDALAYKAGKNIGGSLNERPIAWAREKVGGENFGRDHVFNATPESVKNGDVKLFHIGMAGNPEVNTFARSIYHIDKALKDKYGDNVKSALSLNGRGDMRWFEDKVRKIADYARQNPDQPIVLFNTFDGHGNTNGYGREGAGSGYTSNSANHEVELKRILSRHLNPSQMRNVAIINAFSCCHAGAFLA